VRLSTCTFESHGPILAKPFRKSRNDIGIVWLSPPLFELRKGFGSSDRTFAVTFRLVQAFGTHRVITCKLVDVFQWRGKSMELTAGRTRLSGRAVDRAGTCDESLSLGIH
jgi:hypothetical protein